MAFQITSRDIVLNGSVLKVDCKDFRGNWKSSSLDLNRHFGNVDGGFSVFETDFLESAEDVRLQGATLCATLPRNNSSSTTAAINLNLYIANQKGNLKFEMPCV